MFGMRWIALGFYAVMAAVLIAMVREGLANDPPLSRAQNAFAWAFVPGYAALVLYAGPSITAAMERWRPVNWWLLGISLGLCAVIGAVQGLTGRR